MQVADEYAALNNEPFTANLPAPRSTESFQRQLDKLFGKSAKGLSKVRVVWGQAPDQMMLVCGRWVRKFPYYRELRKREHADPGTGLVLVEHDLYEIGVPRYFVEQLHDSEIEKAGWERARFGTVDGIWQDILGPAPEQGFYTSLFAVGSHDARCCGGRESYKGVPCYGGFRFPGEIDLRRLRRMRHLRDTAPAASKDPLEQAAEWDEKWQEHLDKEFGEVIDDYCKTRSHTWTNFDPALQQWGKWHFMGGHNKSGSPQAEPAPSIVLTDAE